MCSLCLFQLEHVHVVMPPVYEDAAAAALAAAAVAALTIYLWELSSPKN